MSCPWADFNSDHASNMLEQKDFRHAGAIHQMIQLSQMHASTDRHVSGKTDCMTSLTGYAMHALHWSLLHAVVGSTRTHCLQVTASQPTHQEL